MVSEGLHVADDEIWCQKKDYMLQINMVSEGLHAADVEIWCQKGYMRQMMKYGVRRRDMCCR